MPVAMILEAPGFTTEVYDAIMEHMQWDEADLPDGFISHYACPTDDGLYVFDVWESPEDFDRFFHARLSGAMAASLGEVPAIEPRFLPVHNVSHATSRV